MNLKLFVVTEMAGQMNYWTNYNCSQAHYNSCVVVASKLLEKKCSKKNIYFNELTNPTIYVHTTHSSRW